MSASTRPRYQALILILTHAYLHTMSVSPHTWTHDFHDRSLLEPDLDCSSLKSTIYKIGLDVANEKVRNFNFGFYSVKTI